MSLFLFDTLNNIQQMMMRSIIAYVKSLAYSLWEKYVIFEENQYNYYTYVTFERLQSLMSVWL